MFYKKIFLISGHLCLLFGLAGALLPILPTTPFLLLAAYFYSKSSTKLHGWIINHQYFGPPLKNWENGGVIGLKAKVLASLMILLVIFFRLPSLKLAIIIKIALGVILTMVLIFIWSRPSR